MYVILGIFKQSESGMSIHSHSKWEKYILSLFQFDEDRLEWVLNAVYNPYSDTGLVGVLTSFVILLQQMCKYGITCYWKIGLNWQNKKGQIDIIVNGDKWISLEGLCFALNDTRHRHLCSSITEPLDGWEGTWLVVLCHVLKAYLENVEISQRDLSAKESVTFTLYIYIYSK